MSTFSRRITFHSARMNRCGKELEILGVERHFSVALPLPSTVVPPRKIAQVVQEQLTQPRQQLALAPAAESGEIAVRFNKRFLHEIGGAPLGAEFGT